MGKAFATIKTKLKKAVFLSFSNGNQIVAEFPIWAGVVVVIFPL